MAGYSDNNRNHRVSFQELKAKVGVDDVAYSLGYRLDRRAGVGRFFEMTLNSGGVKQDTLVIRNTANKAAQTFFRRDGSHGDVITLIRENLGSFNTSGKNEWEQVTNALLRLAHMPEQTIREDLEHINSNRGNKPFDPDRYETKMIAPNRMPGLLKSRGFSDSTILRFAPFIRLVSDRQNRNFNGFNIGFPYVSGCQEGIVGYEIRGFGGFKSKASGTNSNSAGWVADFSNGNGAMVSDVYFFESAFDAMAFYQLNSTRLENPVRPFALVSLGGTFSDQQVLGVIDRFPNAKVYDCFDNDMPGRVNAARLMAVVAETSIKFMKTEKEITVVANAKSIILDPERPVSDQLSKGLGIDKTIDHMLPPKGFKDWNDCLLGKRENPEIRATKHERNENLAERRKSGMKL